MQMSKKYVEQQAKVPAELAAEIAAARKLYNFNLGKKQSAERFAAATAVNEKLQALGLTALLLFPGDAPEVAQEVAPIIKNGDQITGAAVKKMAGTKKIQVMVDGNWPHEIDTSDIEDSDIFHVEVNYGYEVQFHLGSADGSTIVMIEGVIGTCDDMHGWVIKQDA